MVKKRHGEPSPNSAEDEDELCAMFDESSQWTIVLPEEGLGYELVVPFPAYGFASLVSHNERLQPKQPKGNKTGGKAVTCEQ